ncbi:MAG TPA: tryptophan--tRNA ligase, partial [Lachnospiraceae bacterium]|nr:tryptophan--tRNA ligase [Lachnospiraceae bacterium]
QNLDEMKEHYTKGGLGDVKCKKFLIKVLEEELAPIRARRAEWEKRIPDVYDILKAGTDHAVEETNQTLAEVRSAMRIDYFKDGSIKDEWDKIING